MTMKEKKPAFAASEGMKKEYCAKIVRIGEMKPIEGSDFLVQTLMDGFSCVVQKGAFEVGEPVIYCLNETAVNKKFLSANNQFEIGEYELNANAKEVAALIDEGRKDDAKRLVGFFGKHGRVRMIRLRGCPSYGCIFKFDSLLRWKPSLKDERLEDYLTVDEDGYEHSFNFDTVDGELFAEMYVPMTRNSWRGMGKKKRNSRKASFDRLVPGQFVFHYDTDQLRDNMWRFRPETVVDISVKLHGTSVIVGNLITRIPQKLSLVQQLKSRNIRRQQKQLGRSHPRFYWQRRMVERQTASLEAAVPENFRLGHGPVFSSRTVVKNQYLYDSLGAGFYDADIWSEYGNIFYPFIEKGMTVYGEICGYITGVQSMIQPQYDYGCRAGENFMMPYRITTTDAEGRKREWSVTEVRDWTVRLAADHPELAPRLRPITVLYHGTLAALYPDVPQDDLWRESILERLASDGTRMGMEKNEPMCVAKVPREGLVLRIEGDENAEAFKLKSNKFFERESKLIDQGQVDMEMGAGA